MSEFEKKSVNFIADKVRENMYSIGVDIGGMSIKIGIVDENGNILFKNVVKTARDSETDIDNISEGIKNLLEKARLTVSDVKGIGLGCPGAISSESGVVDILPNLGWVNVPLVGKFKARFDTEIRMSNDANVAALAEALYGAAKGFKNCIMLTLGTGVGGGIIINGKLYEGKDGKGAELGHSTLVMDGYPCSCGRKGCIESYVSATALIRETREAMVTDKNSSMWNAVGGDLQNVDGRTAFEEEKKGDATAKKVVNFYVKCLSDSIMSMTNIFRPDVIILGGGISKQGDNLTSKVCSYCEKFDYGYKGSPRPVIKCAELGNDAGIIGAAALVFSDKL